ncbi:MAG TPA: hypothetical protein VNY73_10990 [Bacteroidia bacterium]|jgi:hypothetical protein|nr:hypothetical protein [Bacteroidia bacterium]
MEAISEHNGVPYIWGVPCIKDKNYRFSSAEFLGLSEWVCPHCHSHISQENGDIICLNSCHLKKKRSKKSN